MAGAEGMLRAPGWREPKNETVALAQDDVFVSERFWGSGDWRFLGILILLCFALHVVTSGIGVLFNETDGQYAGAARAMVDGGDWVVPENNGIPRLVKPPLLVWMVAGSFWVAGVNEFAARLPNAIGLTVWCVGVFLIGRRYGGGRFGFWSGAILATVLGSGTLGRILMPEPWFCAWVTLAIFAGLTALQGARVRAWALAFWGFAGLAVMTKGPHGLLIALAIVGLVAVWGNDRRGLANVVYSAGGVMLFLALVLPWHFLIEARFPGFLWNLIFVEFLGHVVGSHAPATSYTNVPQGQFLAMHVAWFFPWSLIALVQFAGWLRRRGEVAPLSGSGLWRLCAVWAVVGGVPVLLAGQRQDYYAMIAWPAFALVASAFLLGRPVRAAAIFVASVFAAGLGVALLLPMLGIGAEVTAPVADRTTAVESLRQFSPDVWAGLRWLAVWVLGGAGVCAFGAALARSASIARVGLLAASCMVVVGAIIGTGRVAPYFSVGPIAGALQARDLPDGAVMVYDGNIDTGSSLLMYSDLAVHLLDQNPEAEFATREFGVGRDRFWSSDDLVRAWGAGTPIVFVTESGDMDDWSAKLGAPGPRVMARCGTQVVIGNF